ncbi:hypothetical protein [Alienimonas californiensis]|uniref:hypothetical protein n=1 Tax=Alienimonas californiensis TaxID=2527989 RepID=UPI00119DC965|nr:hypothetical protein [Alienimonas californiensis]
MKIGITGHQKLDDASVWPWVEAAMSRELDAAARPLVAVTSLAIGADQLLARLVLERDGSVHAVLPFADIARTLPAENVPTFNSIAGQAKVETLDVAGTEEDAYLAAGKRIVDLADRMLAVWDGLPARGKGGTADIVAFAIESGVPLVHINPLDRTVKSHGR